MGLVVPGAAGEPVLQLGGESLPGLSKGGVWFINTHADHDVGGLRWEVEPICTVLTEHGCPIALTTYDAALARFGSAATRR